MARNKNYVYFVYYNNELVYIGKGINDRYKHINSGCSHVYDANRLHFQGNTFIVTFFCKGVSSNEASKIEKEQILKHRPSWNKRYLEENIKDTLNKYDELRKQLCGLYGKVSLKDRKKESTRHTRICELFMLLVKNGKMSIPQISAYIHDVRQILEAFRINTKAYLMYKPLFSLTKEQSVRYIELSNEGLTMVKKYVKY